MERRIAIRGMKGRKKDSFLLGLVILLSIIFIVSATTFHSSTEKTKIEERVKTYGNWQVAGLGITKDALAELKVDPVIDEHSASRFVGYSEQVGTIGTFDDDYLDLANFKLYEGRMPIEHNEMVLELSQLTLFPREISIGDSVRVQFSYVIFQRNVRDCYYEQLERQRDLIGEFLERIEADPRGNSYRDLQNTINNYQQYRVYFESDEEFEEVYSKEVAVLDTFSSRVWRTGSELEGFDDVRVEVFKRYLYIDLINEYREDGIDNIEEIITKGSQIEERITVTKEFIITGIIEDYSIYWDVGDYNMPTAYITEEGATKLLEQGMYLTKNTDVSGIIDRYIFLGTANRSLSEEELSARGLSWNNLAYGDSEYSTEDAMMYGILAFIFAGTVISVFQIYLSQMKRRSRKLALMKSIGATKAQVIKLLFWEMAYLLMLCIPLGLILGFGAVRFGINITSQVDGTRAIFYVNQGLLGLGLLSGVMAVLIGMAIPLGMALRIPLTGTISTPPKRSKSARERMKEKNNKVNDFISISLMNIRFNKGKMLMTAGLYTIVITVLLSSIHLGFLSFGSYIDQVIEPGKPDYSFEMPVGFSRREMQELATELEAIKGVRVDLFKGGNRAYVWFPGIKDTSFYKALRASIPDVYLREHFGMDETFSNVPEELEYLINEAIIVNTYGVSVESEIYKRIKDSITSGAIDEELFERGEQLIILLPRAKDLEGKDLRDVNDPEGFALAQSLSQKRRGAKLLEYSGFMSLSYSFKDLNTHTTQSFIREGMELSITIPTENRMGTSRTNDVAFHTLPVTAIIDSFSGIGIWPFIDSIEGPVIIGSIRLVDRLYPASIFGMGRSTLSQIEDMERSIYPTRMARTYGNIYIDGNVRDVDRQIELTRVTTSREIKLSSLWRSNQVAFASSFRVASAVAVLGLTIAIITLIILYNIALSKLEGERERIGILQSLGVTKSQFRALYLATGIAYALISTIIGVGIVSILVIIPNIGNGNMIINIKNSLWLYPWWLVVCTLLAYFVIATLCYYLPINKILKNQAVENIASLSR